MGGGVKWYQCARCDAGYPDQGCTCATYTPSEQQRKDLQEYIKGAPSPTAPDRPSNKTMTALGVEYPYGFPPAGPQRIAGGLYQGGATVKEPTKTLRVEVEPPVDPVNNPPHYNQGAVECIDAIESALGPAGFRAYCKGNALKYIWREEHKGGTESIEKAIWYLNRLVKP